MITALEHGQPTGHVPFWELEFQAWDAASGKHVILGREFQALSSLEQERALYANAEILLSVSEEMGFTALTAPNAFWNQAPGQLAYYCLPGDARFRQLEILRELCPDSLMLVAITGGILAADYSIEFCSRMIEAPESIDQMAQTALDGAIERAMRFRDCGAEAVVSPSDVADNSGPFFKPRYMKRWILPYLQEWAARIHEMGMFSILHSDGNLTTYLNDIAETGINALQAIDPVAGMEMQRSRAIVGDRLCLCGNIDCGLLLRGTPQEVFKATRDLLISCKSGGNLVLGSSNAVQPEVPMENYRSMVAAWREFGGYDGQESDDHDTEQ